MVQEVQSENVQREIAEWTAQSHCPRRESLCEDILSKAGDNPNHTVRGLVRLRSFNDLKELEQLPKVSNGVTLKLLQFTHLLVLRLILSSSLSSSFSFSFSFFFYNGGSGTGNASHSCTLSFRVRC